MLRRREVVEKGCRLRRLLVLCQAAIAAVDWFEQLATVAAGEGLLRTTGATAGTTPGTPAVGRG
jgi:hypothetical protein